MEEPDFSRGGSLFAQPASDTDVLIVGAGPVGLSLGLCLARLGVNSIILERHAQVYSHPRAHFVNTRTMELFRMWGIDKRVTDVAYPVEHLPFDMLVPLGGISWEQRKEISPVTVMSCAQDQVEEALLEALADYPHCTLLREHTLVSFVDEGERVTATVSNPNTDSATITARWLVGADGAGSAVRDLMGINLVGDTNLASMVNIYFESRMHPLGIVPPLAMPSLDPDVAGAFVCMDGDRRWCFHLSTEDLVEDADFDQATAAGLIRSAADLADDHPVEVRSIRHWTMSAVVAEKMRRGSTFLVGDAAHAFPPTGGLGMNSGIQDAHNLAWKLASVRNGVGGQALLDSYELERLPIAFMNTLQSLRNANRDSKSDNPSPSSDIIETRASRSVRSRMSLATDSEERDLIEMLEHSVAIGQDLGFAYESSNVVVPDGLDKPDNWVDRYTPNASPGSRAPHIPLISSDGARLSTIDLFDGVFTLVIGREGELWHDAVAALPADLRPNVLRFAPGAQFNSIDVDVDEVYGISAAGALLVRPDGHVACRFVREHQGIPKLLLDTLRTVHGLTEEG